MEPLEGSTLDLIHRRRIRSFAPGYIMILMALGIIVALPLVKVDVVSSSGGMIRPMKEPVELIAPTSGIVDSTILRDFVWVSAGDTILWYDRSVADTRISETRELIKRNAVYIRDISSILTGSNGIVTGKYRQSLRNHKTTLEHMRIEKEFLYMEFTSAEKLYQQEVIPVREYEMARSAYRTASAKMTDQRENYRSILENERFRLQSENRLHTREITNISASLKNLQLIAPAEGTLRQCQGIASGSVIQSGSQLGTISPEGKLVAECYVETRDIPEIQTGMPVRIRFDRKSMRTGTMIETTVSQIDPDAVMVNGRPLFRVRCILEESTPSTGHDQDEHLVLGMTFSASMILYRATLGALLVERIDRWANPVSYEKSP
ncbi:MAG: HlyD family efflux transporter periplasmic adaptor subunit [Bacteroidota bacterium]